jgi:uncharacterized protein (TIGR02145 family)
MSLYLKKFSTHSEYEQYINGSGAILPNVSICTTEGDVHYNPYVDPCASEKVKTTYEWVEIGGVKWATKNIGAKAITDYGQYFSWGGVNGFTADQVTGDCHSKEFSWADYELGDGGSAVSNMTKYNSTDGKTVLEAEDDAATVNMGSDWRMPTTAEFQALGTATTSAWTADYEGSGVAGLVLTSKSDSSKKLFFPACGYCSNGSVNDVGSYGGYWSSSLRSSNVQRAYNLGFDDSGVYWQNSSSRFLGFPVRGVVG